MSVFDKTPISSTVKSEEIILLTLGKPEEIIAFSNKLAEKLLSTRTAEPPIEELTKPIGKAITLAIPEAIGESISI